MAINAAPAGVLEYGLLLHVRRNELQSNTDSIAIAVTRLEDRSPSTEILHWPVGVCQLRCRERDSPLPSLDGCIDLVDVLRLDAIVFEDIGHDLGGEMIIRDAQGRAKLRVLTGAKDDFSGPSILTIVKRSGKRYVSSLAIKEIGARLGYLVPSQKTEAGELRVASVQVIPVHIAGN